MIQQKEILPGVTLRCFRDSRFKQGCLSFQLVREMKKEEAALNALIPAVLLRGTKQHPDLRAITQHLDELYGAAVSTLVRRVGDYQTCGLYCGFMDDRFALEGDRVLEPMVQFLEELLLDSPVENEMEIRMGAAERIVMSDAELKTQIGELIRSEFGVSAMSHLSADDRLRLCLLVRRNFNASVKQIARLLRLSQEVVASVL